MTEYDEFCKVLKHLQYIDSGITDKTVRVWKKKFLHTIEEHGGVATTVRNENVYPVYSFRFQMENYK
jgi:hypothetical protein